ncbi:MAG: nucleoside triphosphate pyrophosphohydrolase [Rhizobiaceae bacterium]|jgi:ATP diphosphatase|nr:nucleoside triphosphate pyrophosphohydrolase [Rhizobiaceae bacterium]
MIASRDIGRLLEIMAALRDPVSGCAWDVAQTFSTIAPYTLEEAHEVADAIARNDMVDLCDELGDLLLQVVFHARMAEEVGAFSFGDVVAAITAKMIRRHPHVFGPQAAPGATLAKGQWEAIKAEEKAAKSAAKRAEGRIEGGPESLLDDVPRALPGYLEATKLQARAARVGFDWPDVMPVLDKLEEEIAELRMAIAHEGADAIRAEFGDLSFAMMNLARHAMVDPEMALKAANAKFRRRFAAIEAALGAEGRAPDRATLAEMDAIWDAVKRAEKEKGA